jgi:hypothetical protein
MRHETRDTSGVTRGGAVTVSRGDFRRRGSFLVSRVSGLGFGCPCSLGRSLSGGPEGLPFGSVAEGAQFH